MGAVALGAAVGVPRLGAADAPEAAPPPSQDPHALAPASDEVRALFGPLTEGSPVSTHWRIERVHAVRAGAIPVVMSTIYGGRFAVEIFREEPGGVTPIGRAPGLALHLVNEGDGGSQTDELKGLGVMWLGRALEARVAEGAPVPRGLETFVDRLARNPNGTFTVPLA